MAEFYFRAVNPKGRIQRGRFSAVSELDLQQHLSAAGMALIEARITKTGSVFSSKRKPDMRELSQFCQHISQLLKAGAKLTDALNDIAETLQPGLLKTALPQMLKEIEEGSSLSDTMLRRRQIFPSPMPALISIGESTGKLDNILQELSTHFEWKKELATRLYRTMAYPIAAFTMMLCVIIFLLVYVVPETKQFLIGMGVELPFHTRLLMEASDIIRNYGLYILAVIFSCGAIAHLYYKRDNDFAYRIDSCLLNLPAVGTFITKMNLARFSHNFALMFGSGIGLIESITAACDTIRNRAIIEAIDTIKGQIQTGNALSTAAKLSGVFPSLIQRMISMGEESNTLAASLTHVANYYETDVHNAARAMIGSIGPIVTLITGFMLLWLIAAIFMPIYDILPGLVA